MDSIKLRNLFAASALIALVIANQNCSQPGQLEVKSETVSAGSVINQDCKDQEGCVPPLPPGPPISNFECKKFVALAVSNNLQIPARDPEGTCYSVKLLDAISGSASSLTSDFDPEVISRDHDSGGPDKHPYLLDSAKLNMILAERRLVKLSGAPDSLAPIKVDNFVLAAIYPTITNGATPHIDHYRVYGTADSTLKGTNSIQFRGSMLNLTSFGPSGTSTVAALDITSNVQINSLHTLEVRALDCGGARELSDVYLLFQ